MRLIVRKVMNVRQCRAQCLQQAPIGSPQLSAEQLCQRDVVSIVCCGQTVLVRDHQRPIVKLFRCLNTHRYGQESRQVSPPFGKAEIAASDSLPESIRDFASEQRWSNEWFSYRDGVRE